ncbi:MAG: hypothetical protein FWB83_00870 [Treponema sp.]|nr:hypothetical protein [Treponema sp.]
MAAAVTARIRIILTIDHIEGPAIAAGGCAPLEKTRDLSASRSGSAAAGCSSVNASWAEITGIWMKSPAARSSRANLGAFSFYPPRSN